MSTTANTPQAYATGSKIGLLNVFGSTLFQLSGVFMLSPLMLLMLKQADVSTTVAGLFAATTWLGIFIVTPFASIVTKRMDRKTTMWLTSAMPLVAALGFFTTTSLGLWFALVLVAGLADGLRWVLAEALVAEFAPPGQTGRYIGAFATMIGLTLVGVGAAVHRPGLDGVDSGTAARSRHAHRPCRAAWVVACGVQPTGDHAGGVCRWFF
jgi:predicted MFS family arabinose efflux permease